MEDEDCQYTRSPAWEELVSTFSIRILSKRSFITLLLAVFSQTLDLIVACLDE